MPDWESLPNTQCHKGLDVLKTIIALVLLWFLCCAAESTKLHHAWERHYPWQWEVPLGCVNYFIPLGEEELRNLHWDPIVLLQAGPIETYYTWNGTCTIERGGKMRVPIWHIPHQARLLMPDGAASSGQQVWYVQPGQILKAAVTLTSKD